MNSENFVITIGRQLGAGGADLGKMLAEHYGFEYIDREILVMASKQLNTPEESLRYLEEKKFSVWTTFAQANICDMRYIPEEWYLPTGNMLFETQSRILEKAAEESSCVIVGRCASYLFENHDKHVSIFLHADMETRKKRLEASGKLKMFGEDAEKAILKEDKERSRYFSNYTGKKWLDLTSYNLTIDTGQLSLDEAKKVVIAYIDAKFPEIAG